MNIILYKSATCPQCKVAKMKLEKKGIPFTEVMDMETITARGVEGIPTLEVDGELIYPMSAVNKWINEQEAQG
jgi:glutaredoxin